MIITPRLKQWLIDGGHIVPQAGEQTYKMTAARLLTAGTLTAETYRELSEPMSTTSPDPTKVFNRNPGETRSIRVKAPGEAYDEMRYIVKHAKTGMPAHDPVYGRECRSMSEGSKARAGVLLKHLARRGGVLGEPASEHEAAMLAEMVEKQAWAGRIGIEDYDFIGGGARQVKALIDDNTSGGLEIVPIEFDSDIITFPLLTGELFPMVDLRPVPRGRRIEGASIGTPTVTWSGSGDNTEVTLFNTNAMVAAIDTTIFDVGGAVEVGRDFMSDSPVTVGEVLTQLVGERLSQTLDAVVAYGNGTTQPEGLFNASGVGTVTTDNGGSGPPTLADYIDLLFALPKQYRTPQNRVCFISNDTTYARSRAIRVDDGGSTDQRPVLTSGDTTSFNTYSTLGFPQKIENNNIPNTRCGIAAMARYRMYRRLGLEIRFETGGSYLARRNLALLVYRARFGGRLMDGSAFAKWTNGQS